MELLNVFCLPFAGASKYSYQKFAQVAPRKLNIIPYELPGRGARYKEALLTNMENMVDDFLSNMLSRLNTPYVIYGHSMGALLGYMITKKLADNNLKLPKHLFLSGRGGPSVSGNYPHRSSLPKKEFIKNLQELGGSPDKVLEDNGLMEIFEPILRADFKSIESYQYATAGPLEVSITCLIGTEEATTYEEALAWRKETSLSFCIKEFPGKHFFIFDHAKEIVNIIQQFGLEDFTIPVAPLNNK